MSCGRVGNDRAQSSCVSNPSLWNFNYTVQLIFSNTGKVHISLPTTVQKKLPLCHLMWKPSNTDTFNGERTCSRVSPQWRLSPGSPSARSPISVWFSPGCLRILAYIWPPERIKSVWLPSFSSSHMAARGDASKTREKQERTNCCWSICRGERKRKRERRGKKGKKCQ